MNEEIRIIPVFDQDGVRLFPLSQMAEETGVKHQTLRVRRSRGLLDAPAGWVDERTPVWRLDQMRDVVPG